MTTQARKIGELAAATGLTVRTLHYYEEIGLLPPPARTAAGHRVYGDRQVERLYRILLLRRLGLSLDDVAQALGDRDWDVRAAMGKHLDHLDAHLEAMGRLRGRPSEGGPPLVCDERSTGNRPGSVPPPGPRWRQPMTKATTMAKKQTEKKTTPKKTREAKTKAPTAAAAAKKQIQAEATKPTQAKKETPPAPEATAAARKGAPIVSVAPRTPDPRLPAPGTVLQKRDRHGAVRCECTVEEGGIRYAGKVYRSLSSAAMAAAKNLGLNNKTQNGFTFWGLSKPPRAPRDPLAALEHAWERYHGNVAALVKGGVTDENRNKVLTTIKKHAQTIESLREKVA